MNRKDILSIFLSAVDISRRKDISFLSAGIGFYAFFSLIPLILIGISVASLLGGEQLAERTVNFTEIYLSAEGEQVLSEAFSESTGRIGASTVGSLALVWSALKVFRGVNTAFDKVYGSENPTPFRRTLFNSTVVVVSIAVGGGLVLGARTAAETLGDMGVPYVGILGGFVSVAGLLTVLLPLYYVMPPEPVSPVEILPGTLTTLLGWLLLQAVFRIYAENAFQYSAYGLIGAVLLFLLWLYLGAMVLLFGAAVNVAVRGNEEA